MYYSIKTKVPEYTIKKKETGFDFVGKKYWLSQSEKKILAFYWQKIKESMPRGKIKQLPPFQEIQMVRPLDKLLSYECCVLGDKLCSFLNKTYKTLFCSSGI